VAAAVVLLDQATKWLIQARVPLEGAPVPVVPGYLWLHHVHNNGSAFGQFRGTGPLLIAAAVVASGCIIVYRARLKRRSEPVPRLLSLGLALALGGAIGNMVDRVRLGEVVDFLDVGWFPVFNLADTAITLGALALIVHFFFAPADSDKAEAPAGVHDAQGSEQSA
jgi:signal peptidase II